MKKAKLRRLYLESSEVNNTIDGRVLLEHGIECGLIGHVDLVKGWAPSAEELNAINGNLRGVVEVVDNDDIVAILEKREGREGSNVSGSSENLLC